MSAEVRQELTEVDVVKGQVSARRRGPKENPFITNIPNLHLATHQSLRKSSPILQPPAMLASNRKALAFPRME